MYGFNHHPKSRDDSSDYPSIYSQLVWASQHQVEEQYLKWRAFSENVTMCWLILKGEVQLTNDDEEILAKEGEWVFISSKDAIQHFQKDSELISIRFILEHLGGKPLYQRKTHQCFQADLYPELNDAAKHLIRTIQPWQQEHSILLSHRQTPLRNFFEIEAAFNLWLASYISVMDKLETVKERAFKLDSRVEKALLYIEHHPLNERFNEEHLSKQVGISINQLLLLFRKETGTSPFQYYNQRRLKIAQHALLESAAPIKELAFDLGFGSPSHFSTWFKKGAQCSPREYRNRNQD